MIQLVYISKASDDFKLTVNDGLNDILMKSQSNNSRLNLTGILIYNSGIFLQLLEGEQEAIDELYQRISSDKRHTDLSLLVKQNAKERIFPKWSMTFCNLDDDKYASFRNSKEWSSILQSSLDNKHIEDIELLDFIEKFRLHL